MRILLDECLDRRFANSLSGHSVSTVSSQGWTGLTNGQLLSRAQRLFDAFVTVDANIEFQQNVAAYDISIVVVKARSNRVEDLDPLAPAVLRAVVAARKGTITRVAEAGSLTGQN